jgi:hypothetical protein
MIIVPATREIDINQIVQVERYEVCTLFCVGSLSVDLTRVLISP